MGRLVGGSPPGAKGGGSEDYYERVAKYVPVEIVAAYLALEQAYQGAGPDGVPTVLRVVAYVGLVVMTFAYLTKVGGAVPQKTTQVVIGTIAFVVWSYAIGGLFFWGALSALLGVKSVVYPFLQVALALFWTLGAGLYEPKT